MTGRELHSQLDAALERIAETEDRLNALQAELEHAHRLSTLGVLAAGVAHEINNLITPAMAYTQLAQSRPGDLDTQAKAVDRSAKAMDGCSKIISAILSFSAAEQETPVSSLDMGLENALACLARDLEKDGIEFNRSVPAGLHVRIGAVELQQILLNLILNARKALLTERGHGRRITVVTATGRSDDMLEIQVIDNGPGIPSSIADRLFEPFIHCSPGGDDTRQSEGSGLGLAITRRLIERVGGEIHHERPKQGGARFVVTLPIAPAPALAKAS